MPSVEATLKKSLRSTTTLDVTSDVGIVDMEIADGVGDVAAPVLYCWLSSSSNGFSSKCEILPAVSLTVKFQRKYKLISETVF